MAKDFLEFYRSKGNNLSDIDIYYDFDTGNLEEVPVGGFFMAGNTERPIVYNKNSEITQYNSNAIGENFSGFYDEEGSGNLNKSSPGEASYLKVFDGSNLSGASNWTFLITTNKSGTNNGLIFSSLSGDKGFNIGFNDTHNFYLESPSGVFVSELNYASYNGLFLSKNASNFNIGRYNFDKKKFDFESFRMDGVSHGENWFIGGTPNEQILESSFSGIIDNFVYFNKKINNTKLNSVFSGVLTVDQSSLGFIDLTGKRVTTTGFVESGIRNIFEESADISGRFSVLKETIPFNSNIIKTGHINDLCGNREPLYGSGNKIGVKKGNFFIEYSGNFTESTSSVTNNNTSGSIFVTRQLLTGFESQVTLSTGDFVNLIFQYNCLNECGNVEPIFSFESGTGIVSGFNFIPLSGLVSGIDSTTIETGTLKEVSVHDIIDQSCGFHIDSGYVDQYGFDSIFINKYMRPNALNQSLVSSGDLNLNNLVEYNNTKRFFNIPQKDLDNNFFAFYSGHLQVSGENYDIRDNNKITGHGLNSSGAFTYGNLSVLKIRNVSDTYTLSGETSLLFTGEKNTLHTILTGSGSTHTLSEIADDGVTSFVFGGLTYNTVGSIVNNKIVWDTEDNSVIYVISWDNSKWIQTISAVPGLENTVHTDDTKYPWRNAGGGLQSNFSNLVGLSAEEFKAMEFNDNFQINSGDNHYLSFNKFFEKSSMVFSNGEKMLHGSEYLETANNKRLRSGIFEVKGDSFGAINEFFDKNILGNNILLQDGNNVLTQSTDNLSLE